MTKERQQQIVDEAREFAAVKIRPFAKAFEDNEAIPESLIAELGEAGYLGASLPEEYGGLDLDAYHYGLLTEEIGKACCSTRSLLTVHTSLVGETLVRWATDEQKKKWLPELAAGKKIAAFALSEPNIGSNAKGITTSYRKTDKGYILNGEKKWITFGHRADLFLVIAADDGDISAFMVERNCEGVVTEPITGMLAGRASYISNITFKDVFIPEENCVGSPGNGFTYIANTALDNGRFSIAFAGLAIAQEALDVMVSYSRQRNQFGQKICNFQLVQGLIGDAVTQVHAARALCASAAQKRMAKDPNAVMETTIAKYFTSEAAMKVATDAVQVLGGNGCHDAFPTERLFREAKILAIIEGTSQIQQEIIAKFGLLEYFKGPLFND